MTINVANFCLAKCLWVDSDRPIDGLVRLLAGSDVEIDEVAVNDFTIAYETPAQAQALIADIESFGEVCDTTPYAGLPNIGVMNAA